MKRLKLIGTMVLCVVTLGVTLPFLQSGSKDEKPINAQFKPYREVEACVAAYPEYMYLHRSLGTLADWMLQAINVNQEGLHVFVDTLGGGVDPADRTVAN